MVIILNLSKSRSQQSLQYTKNEGYSICASNLIMASGLKMFSLESQTALITGATRGIGQAAALGLAEAGADIILIQVCVSD